MQRGFASLMHVTREGPDVLTNHLSERGEFIPASSLILSGGITEAVSVQAGDNVTLRVQDIGSTSIRFV